MSKANAAYALSPGDRDEPDLPLAASNDLHAGRDVAEPTSTEDAAMLRDPAHALLPGLELVLDQVRPAINELDMAFGELTHARNHDQLASFKSAARRLADLTNHVHRVAKQYGSTRRVRAELQQKE